MNQKPLFLTVTLIALLTISGAFWLASQRAIAPTAEPMLTDPVVEPMQYPQHIEGISGNADEVWYNIPELGVRMKLNKEFAEDLIYSISRIKKTYGEKEEFDVAYFSTESMMHIDAFCAPNKGASMGAISRNNGVAREAAKSDEYMAARLNDLIQIDNFYYVYTKPQAACWDPSLTEEVLKLNPSVYSGIGIKSLDDGFKEIELIIEGK